MKVVRKFLFDFKVIFSLLCFIFIFLFILLKPKRTTFNIQEKPITIVTLSYNNKSWYKNNLSSILSQQYKNYRVIYIDDCSTDGTYDLVKQYLEFFDTDHRVTLMRNETRQGILANHYTAIHLCKDNEIVVHLDGDDWFKHDAVLARVNKEYADPNVWLTFGQFEAYPHRTIGFCEDIPQEVVAKNLYRQYAWRSSHLRTFYAWLAKRIDKKDLCDEYGEFIKSAVDLALMYPMLEMAAGRFKFIPDILYVYNRANVINDSKVIQPGFSEYCVALVCSKNRYQGLDELLLDNHYALFERKDTCEA